MNPYEPRWSNHGDFCKKRVNYAIPFALRAPQTRTEMQRLPHARPLAMLTIIAEKLPGVSVENCDSVESIKS